jgi:hypothetical protein
MKYASLVKSEYKQYKNDDYLIHSNESFQHYAEGFSDGMFQAFVALKKSNLLSPEQVLGVIQTIDKNGDSAAFEILSEIYEEELV